MHSQSSLRGNFLTLAAPPLLLTLVLYTLQHTSSEVAPIFLPSILRRDEEAGCPVDLSAPDACYLVKQQCGDFDSDGLVPYLRLYACASNFTKPLLLPMLGLWLVVLFASMATVAKDFLAVHLEFIVKTLNINENLAGVTIFAFGNGCTDLFSTLAAMEANSGSLAISELFGAAAFITTVVLGTIAFIQPFSVDPRALVADVIWFIIAASLLIAFLADGQLVLAECLGIIGLYAAFILFALLRPHAKDQVAIVTASNLAAPEQSSDEDGESSRENEDDLIHLDSPTDETQSETDGTEDSEAVAEVDHTRLSRQHSPFVHTLATSDATAAAHNDQMASPQELDDLDLPPDARLAREMPHSQPESSVWEALLLSFPPIASWNEQSVGEKLLTCFSLPFLLGMGLTIPPCSGYDSKDSLDMQTNGQNRPVVHHSRMEGLQRYLRGMIDALGDVEKPRIHEIKRNCLLCLQLTLGPQLISGIILKQSEADDYALILGAVTALLFSACLITYIFSSPHHAVTPTTKPRGSLAISVLAFATSLIYIYLTATSAVTLLMTLALILRIPNALLGATVFAIGQSSNDLVANAAVARRGMPVLAASATFGGPMMNMLIGIGGGGLIQVVKSKAKGDSGIYSFEVGAGVFVSAACLILGLCVMLGYTFWNGWRLERGLATTLTGIWIFSTFTNVALSMTAR